MDTSSNGDSVGIATDYLLYVFVTITLDGEDHTEVQKLS